VAGTQRCVRGDDSCDRVSTATVKSVDQVAALAGRLVATKVRSPTAGLAWKRASRSEAMQPIGVQVPRDSKPRQASLLRPGHLFRLRRQRSCARVCQLREQDVAAEVARIGSLARRSCRGVTSQLTTCLGRAAHSWAEQHGGRIVHIREGANSLIATVPRLRTSTVFEGGAKNARTSGVGSSGDEMPR
jgi:hypothetical protein